MLNLVWCKSDLRVSDNPALYESMSSGPTVAVYVICPNQWHKHGISDAKQALILRQLLSLRSSLGTLNVPLVILSGSDFVDLPLELIELAKSLDVRRLYWNREYELNEKHCEKAVRSLCGAHNIISHEFDDGVLFRPGSIVKDNGEEYKVFSAFKRALLKKPEFELRRLYPVPARQAEIDQVDTSPGVSDASLEQWALQIDVQSSYECELQSLWPAGEDEAHSRLDVFMEASAARYHEERDFPALSSTSSLSAYLATGIISPRQCLQAALNDNNGSMDEGNVGLTTWINELIWREFYRHLLNANEHLCRFKPFKPETDRLPWRHDTDLFESWKHGRTGFPIVDAAMRQLNQTGWMHNRLRMIVAMFLTKHLFIDWRWGESYFMSKLVDGDLAANNGGWQWSASTGVDAVPYFRIFNPVRQSLRFDPEGEFIKQYVPELRALDGKSIHQPSEAQALSLGYVLPVVEHKQATDQTKYYFSQLNSDLTANIA